MLKHKQANHENGKLLSPGLRTGQVHTNHDAFTTRPPMGGTKYIIKSLRPEFVRSTPLSIWPSYNIKLSVDIFLQWQKDINYHYLNVKWFKKGICFTFWTNFVQSPFLKYQFLLVYWQAEKEITRYRILYIYVIYLYLCK